MAVCCAVFGPQAAIFRELVNVRYRADCEIIIGNVPLFRTVQWCWYGVATFYTYGDFLLEVVVVRARRNRARGARRAASVSIAGSCPLPPLLSASRPERAVRDSSSESDARVGSTPTRLTDASTLLAPTLFAPTLLAPARLAPTLLAPTPLAPTLLAPGSPRAYSPRAYSPRAWLSSRLAPLAPTLLAPALLAPALLAPPPAARVHVAARLPRAPRARAALPPARLVHHVRRRRRHDKTPFDEPLR